MLLRITVVILLLAAEAGMAYYSLVVDKSLLARFLFFLLSAGIICIMIIKGVQHILPDENQPNSEDNLK